MPYPHTGSKREKGSGNQKTYDGKVNWQDLSRFEYVGQEDGVEIYTLILNHVSLKRNVRVVVLRDKSNKDKQAILFSTDADLDAKTLLMLGLDPTLIKKSPQYQKLRDYGKIAA